MTDVATTGLFSLGGVVLGALLLPFTQSLLERRRERRASDRARLLIAGELLHAQMMLRAASQHTRWNTVDDLDSFLPTFAWRDHRSSLAGHVDEDLWTRLITGYALIEIDRSRFRAASLVSRDVPLTPEEAESLKRASNVLGDLRRRLGLGGGWREEIEDMEIDDMKRRGEMSR
jgi:hypothetical protein